ncbi:FliM/FliN family flagellar motor switch protein [Labilithrix luteola]|nr:FliM/FliN family flagellar motor switch protein [Labilithrix luteola]
MTDPQALLRIGLVSERAKRAEERLKAERKGLEGAVRRTLPFLVRRKIGVTMHEVRCVLLEEVIASVTRPYHVTPVFAGDRIVGALVLDGFAVAAGLDGVLGASKDQFTVLDPAGLSSAQAALASRVARGLVAAFDEALSRCDVRFHAGPDTIGSSASHRPPHGEGGSSSPEPGGLLVACTLRMGEDELSGHVTLLLPAAWFDSVVPGPAQTTEPEPRTTAAMAFVELDVIAELGRVKVPLTRLATLKVGDVIRLPLPVDARAHVRVGDRALFQGKPTTRGAQLAIALE